MFQASASAPLSSPGPTDAGPAEELLAPLLVVPGAAHRDGPGRGPVDERVVPGHPACDEPAPGELGHEQVSPVLTVGQPGARRQQHVRTATAPADPVALDQRAADAVEHLPDDRLQLLHPAVDDHRPVALHQPAGQRGVVGRQGTVQGLAETAPPVGRGQRELGGPVEQQAGDPGQLGRGPAAPEVVEQVAQLVAQGVALRILERSRPRGEQARAPRPGASPPSRRGPRRRRCPRPSAAASRPVVPGRARSSGRGSRRRARTSRPPSPGAGTSPGRAPADRRARPRRRGRTSRCGAG